MNEPALIYMQDLCHCQHSTFLILFSVSYCLYGRLEAGMAEARMQMDFHLYNVLGSPSTLHNRSHVTLSSKLFQRAMALSGIGAGDLIFNHRASD